MYCLMARMINAKLTNGCGSEGLCEFLGEGGIVEKQLPRGCCVVRETPTFAKEANLPSALQKRSWPAAISKTLLKFNNRSEEVVSGKPHLMARERELCWRASAGTPVLFGSPNVSENAIRQRRAHTASFEMSHLVCLPPWVSSHME